jgi:hypothetical protein
MNALDRFDQFDHPAWLTAAGTLASYGLILLFLFGLLFVLPYLVYAMVL